MNLKKTITSLSLGLLLATSVAGVSAQESTAGVLGDATATECVTDLGRAEIRDAFGGGGIAEYACSGFLGDATATECVTDLGTAEVPENATGYVVTSEESQASFTVTEELAGSGVTDAVGTTNAVIGTLLVDADGNPLACSRIDVDLRTLVTDESRRDSRIQEALNTTENPVATFIVTEISVLDSPLEEGVETQLTLIGNLTINGVEKQVSWDATVTLADGSITGTATTVIQFDEFEVDKPVLGPVMSIEDDVTLTIDLVAAAQ